VCVGNPTVQIYTLRISGFLVCLRNYWRFDVFLSFKWLFSCSRTNVDSRLLDSAQCCTYVLTWVKFLIEDVLECLNMHAIKCHIWVSRNMLPLLNKDWLFSAYDQSHTLSKSMPHNNLEYGFPVCLIKTFLHCYRFCDASLAFFV
jgi:hypothetical protein